MESLYLSQVDFKIAEEETLDELEYFQNKQMAKSFLKRLLVILAIIGIIVLFQIMARYTVPHMFGKKKTVERLLRLNAYAFMILNILSYLELVLRFKVFFNKEKDKVKKVKVIKKIVNVKTSLIPVKQRILVCECDGHFLVDYIFVDSAITYSNIKTGDEIYIKQLNDEGHHKYELVA